MASPVASCPLILPAAGSWCTAALPHIQNLRTSALDSGAAAVDVVLRGGDWLPWSLSPLVRFSTPAEAGFWTTLAQIRSAEPVMGGSVGCVSSVFLSRDRFGTRFRPGCPALGLALGFRASAFVAGGSACFPLWSSGPKRRTRLGVDKIGVEPFARGHRFGGCEQVHVAEREQPIDLKAAAARVRIGTAIIAGAGPGARGRGRGAVARLLAMMIGVAADAPVPANPAGAVGDAAGSPRLLAVSA